MKPNAAFVSLVVALFVAGSAPLPANPPRSLRIGSPLPALEFRGNGGGTTNGEPWSTDALPGAALIILGTPDGIRSVRETTAELETEIEDERTVSFVTIIDLSTTLLPYGLLRSRLQRTQENRPETRIVVDRRGATATTWFPNDKVSESNSVRVVAIDREGIVLGTWNAEEFRRAGAAGVISHFAESSRRER